MQLTRNRVFSIILIFSVIAGTLVYFDIQYLYLKPIVSFIFLTIIPGLIILLLLKIRGIDFWQYLVYTIGSSIGFLIFGGLYINWALPLIGIEIPLSTISLPPSLYIILIPFFILAFIRNRELSVRINKPRLNTLSLLFFIIPVIFPILSIMGANILNNGGPNYVTMVMIAGIAVFVILTVIFRDQLNQNVYPWIILLISVSLILMFSLRSTHITGWDIHKEYQMFQSTKEYFHWNIMNFPGDLYNACMSITILPTVFSSFMNINDEYIFKLVFQIIFAFVPVIVFIFFNRYTQKIIAFLAIFLFISKPEFILGMPTLIRQEISFLFFALFLALLFETGIKYGIGKYSLLILFGFAMIASHYSTSNIAIALFIFMYVIWFFFRKTENKKFFLKIYQKLNLKEKRTLRSRKNYLGISVIILLLIFSFLWFFPLTKTSGNFTYFYESTVSNVGKMFTNEMKSEEVLSALGFSEDIYDDESIGDYTDKAAQEYRSGRYPEELYGPEIYKNYITESRYGETISPFSNTVKNINGYTVIIINRLIQIFMLIGVFYLLFLRFKDKKPNEEYIILSIGCLLLMILIILIPYISLAYNFERLFLQCLMVIALPIVLGITAVFKFLKNKTILLVIISVLFVWVLLSNTGFSANIFGGEPNMVLNNFGETYGRFYTHESDVKSIEWLSRFNSQKDEIYMDEYAELRIKSFTDIDEYDIRNDILPPAIYKNAYVYASYENKVNDTVRVVHKEEFYAYNFPSGFLDDNKNKIYSNGNSEIYK